MFLYKPLDQWTRYERYDVTNDDNPVNIFNAEDETFPDSLLSRLIDETSFMLFSS